MKRERHRRTGPSGLRPGRQRHGTADGPLSGRRGEEGNTSGGGNRRAGRSRGRGAAEAVDVHVAHPNPAPPQSRSHFSPPGARALSEALVCESRYCARGQRRDTCSQPAGSRFFAARSTVTWAWQSARGPASTTRRPHHPAATAAPETRADPGRPGATVRPATGPRVFPDDWVEVEKYVGSSLPGDFKTFLDAYGTGLICGELVVFHPQGARPLLDGCGTSSSRSASHGTRLRLVSRCWGRACGGQRIPAPAEPAERPYARSAHDPAPRTPAQGWPDGTHMENREGWLADRSARSDRNRSAVVQVSIFARSWLDCCRESLRVHGFSPQAEELRTVRRIAHFGEVSGSHSGAVERGLLDSPCHAQGRGREGFIPVLAAIFSRALEGQAYGKAAAGEESAARERMRSTPRGDLTGL